MGEMKSVCNGAQLSPGKWGLRLLDEPCSHSSAPFGDLALRVRTPCRLGLTGGVLERNQQKIDHVIANAETLSTDAVGTLRAARERYVDGPQITRIMNDAERGAQVMARDIGPLVSDSREVLGDAKKITRVLADDQKLAQLGSITTDLGDAARTAKTMATDAQSMMARVKQGQGTAGALLKDEALYDDLSELVRDLKHNPWKILWKQ